MLACLWRDHTLFFNGVGDVLSMQMYQKACRDAASLTYSVVSERNEKARLLTTCKRGGRKINPLQDKRQWFMSLE